MAGLKLSDLNPEDVQPVESDSKSLKLSDLHPDDVKPVESHEEDLSPKPREDISKLESGGQGALQGATAGFSDELGGALGAGMEKVLPGGNKEGKSLKELYQEYRDFQRKRNNEFQQANPGSYLTGEIGGAIASTALAPGANTVRGGAGLGALTGLGASDADLTSGSTGDMKQAAKDVALGTAMGTGGSLLGKGIQKLLSPKALETAGSKLASKSVGIKPSKELTTQWVKEGEHWVPKEGSDVIKGIGKTAVEEGALPTFGGNDAIYDSTLNAIKRNESKLNPLLQKAQQGVAPDALDQVGHIGDKVGSFMQDFVSEIPNTSKREGLIKKLFQTYAPQIEKLNAADGDLVQLNKLKRGFQDAATELDKNVFERDAATEAQFVKQLGGIVREHIEDLANSGGQGLGQEIKGVNKTLSNLYNYGDASKKAIDKGSGDFSIKNLGMAFAANTAQKSGAKGMIGASKMINTPAGQLITRPAPKLVEKAITNPFSIEQAEQATGTYADRMSANLYSATDESLKSVAEKLKQDPGLAHAAEELQKAIDLKDEQRKNNAIFLLLQKPNARKFLTPEE